MSYCEKCTALREEEASALCGLCQHYSNNLEAGLLEEELRGFIAKASGEGALLVEFSGGRHSAIALGLARLELDLDVIAVILSNGWIPSKVLEQARTVTRGLGCRLIEVEANLGEPPGRDGQRVAMSELCTSCNRHLNSAVFQISSELGLHHVANGENKYRQLTPKVTSRGSLSHPDGRKLEAINLPFALRVTKARGEEILKQIGWKDLGIPGHSSNCLVPWLSEEAANLEAPGNALVEMIAAEVRSGYMTREQGFAALEEIVAGSPEQLRVKRKQALEWSRSRPHPKIVYDSLSSSQ